MGALIAIIKIVLILTGIAVWALILSIVGGIIGYKVMTWWSRANGL